MLTAQQKQQVDPTRTLTLRTRYAQAGARRFDGIRRDVRVTVTERDAFGLRPGRPPVLLDPARRRAFAFPTSERKIEAFMAWLREQVDKDVLEIVETENGQIRLRRRWQDQYVQAAYGKGITDSRRRLSQAGLAFPDETIAALLTHGIHADRVQLLFTRNFEELRGITQAMAQSLSRELSQGLIEGVGADALAQRLTQRVTTIGRQRAQLLARTEVVRAHAEGTLNEFERLGVSEVTAEIEAEFLTARDARVCIQCLALEGERFPISEARGIIPVHPLCRCSWLPANIGETAAELRRSRARRDRSLRRREQILGRTGNRRRAA